MLSNLIENQPESDTSFIQASCITFYEIKPVSGEQRVKLPNRLNKVMHVWDHIVNHHKNELVEFLLMEDGTDFNIMDSNGWCPMSRAIDNGNVEIMKLLILKSKGVDLNKPSCKGYTPLTFSVFNENFEILKELLNSGADVNQKDDFGWTPLKAAIDMHNAQMIRLLCTNGAELNLIYRPEGWSPLTYAIEEKDCNLEIVRLLVDNGADINLLDGNGGNPFHEAISQQRKDIVDFFLEIGVNKSIKTEFCGSNSIELTMRYDCVNMMKQLIYL